MGCVSSQRKKDDTENFSFEKPPKKKMHPPKINLPTHEANGQDSQKRNNENVKGQNTSIIVHLSSEDYEWEFNDCKRRASHISLKTELSSVAISSCNSCTSCNLSGKRYIFKENEYFISNTEKSEKVNQTEARDRCLQCDGDLASFSNQEEFDFVENLLNKSEFWIGLKTLGAPQTRNRTNWFWLDETKYNLSLLNNWHPGEPSGISEEECGRIGKIYSQEGKWMDAPCHHKYNYICKFEYVETISMLTTQIGGDTSLASQLQFSTTVAVEGKSEARIDMKEDNMYLYIGIGAGCFILVLIILIPCIVFLRKRRKKDSESANTSNAHQYYSYVDVNKESDIFKECKKNENYENSSYAYVKSLSPNVDENRQVYYNANGTKDDKTDTAEYAEVTGIYNHIKPNLEEDLYGPAPRVPDKNF